jgi:hypothetical protein
MFSVAVYFRKSDCSTITVDRVGVGRGVRPVEYTNSHMKPRETLEKYT